MKVTQGNLYWNKNIGIIKTYPYVSKNRKCDVLVIGGGIAGALTAYMQAKQGAHVIVVEKNILGYGSTIETDGTIQKRLDLNNNKFLKNMSQKNIIKCNRLCENAVNDISDIIKEIAKDEECAKYIDKIDFNNADVICYSDRLTNKLSMYKLFEKLGKENNQVEYLEEDPIINLRTGIIVPSGGVILNPYALTQLIFLYLSKQENVEIYENTYITNISQMEEKLKCITNNRFKIISDYCILTSGVNTLEYLKNAELSVNRNFTIVTEKVNSLDENVVNVVAKDINYPNTTIAFTKDKRVILSSEDIKETNRILNEGHLKSYMDGKYKKMYNMLHKLINFKEDVNITNCFYGLYLETKDSLPIVDEIEQFPNVYCNLGVGRNGIVYSMIGATLLKDISKQYHIKDMYLFRENR